MRRRALSDQIESRLSHSREIGGFAVTMDVHVEHSRAFEEEMVVQGRDFKAIAQQRRHYRVDLILQKDQVAHHHIDNAGAFCHRERSAKSKRRGSGDAVNGYLEVVTRYVYFEHVALKIALLPK